MSRRGRWVVALVWALPAAAVLAAGPAEKVRRGNESYLAGDLEGALARYTDAQVDVPDSPVLHYNIGNVLFRQGDYERAMDEYRLAELSDDPALRRSARFNIGNARFLSQEFDKAVEDYARVLRESPGDVDAKRNLELALRALEEEQQQQQQQQQDDQQEQQDQQEQDPQQQDSQQPEESQDEQESPAREDRRDEPQEQQEGSQEPEPREKPADPQQAEGETPQQADGMQAGEPDLPEEEAARILDALKQEEKENMKRALRAARTGRGTGKDW
ncbi:MAG: tetratricopeptide repeat protein [Acidobacteriota bacterium]|jgi:Ca-activated chloride channel family protein